MVERVGRALEQFRWWLEGRVVTHEAAGEIARKVVSNSVCGAEDDRYRPRVMPLFVEPTKSPRRDLPSLALDSKEMVVLLFVLLWVLIDVESMVVLAKLKN